MAGNHNSGRRAIPISEKLDAGTYRPRDGMIPDGATGVPVRPSSVTGAARKLWELIVPDLISRGLAKAVDGPALEGLCETWGLYKAALKAAKKVPTDPATKNAVMAYLAQCNAIGRKFGLTFGDRQKLKIKPKPDGPAGVPTRQRG